MDSNTHQRLDKRYEALTAELIRRFSTNGRVVPNDFILGRSGRNRQVDVAVYAQLVGQPLFVAFECKHYKRPVGVGKIDEFIGKIDDINANAGVLVSDSGYDAGALARAKEYGRIQLCQLVDSKQGWLRTRLAVPLCVSFIGITDPYKCGFGRRIRGEDGKTTMEPLFTTKPEHRSLLIAFISAHGEAIIREFNRWCGTNIQTLADGIHHREVRLPGSEDFGIYVVFTFRRQTDTFVNDAFAIEGSGLFDAMSGKLVLGDAKSFRLEEAAIRASWQPAPENFDPKGRPFFQRYASYSVEIAAGAAQGLLRTLEKC
jgi:hypothetical protein